MDFSNSSEDWINYKKACAVARRTFKQTKIDKYKTFAANLNFIKNSTYAWNMCRIFHNKWVQITQSHYSENLQENKNIEIALDKICPPWVPTNPDIYPTSAECDHFETQFSFLELNVALEDKNMNSAPGMDGVDFEVIDSMPIKFKLLLLDIFNHMYATADFPQSWTNSFVHFIPKADGINLRPISLTPCFCKLMETMIKNRLQWWAEFNNLIPPSQHGFRKGKSCQDNLITLKLAIEESFIEKKETLAAFLDTHAAFDNVNVNILLDKLASIGCSKHIIAFVKHLMHTRNVFSIFNLEIPRMVCKEVPQGGVLSPLLYLLYVADITVNISKRVTVLQFADDLAVCIKFKSIKRNKKILENSVKKIHENLYNIGLDLSPAKTVLVHFNNKNILPVSTEITIDGHVIKSERSARFLGITFDYNMTFSTKREITIKKCTRALNMIKFLRGTWWGSSPDTHSIIYKSFIRSIIDYGSFIYF